jgi:hypothetical protein
MPFLPAGDQQLHAPYTTVKVRETSKYVVDVVLDERVRRGKKEYLVH